MELQFVKELMDNIFNNPVRQIWEPIQELLVLLRELWQPKVHFFLARRLFWGVLPKLYKYITDSFDMCQKLFYLKAYVFTLVIFVCPNPVWFVPGAGQDVMVEITFWLFNVIVKPPTNKFILLGIVF